MSKSLRWLALLAGIASLIAGGYMFTHPAVSLASMAIVFACIFMVDGISTLVSYFSQSPKNGWLLFSGIITILLSISLLSGSFIDMALFIPYVFVIWVLVAGITRIAIGIRLKKLGGEKSTSLIVMGVLGIIASLIMLSHPLITGIVIAYIVGSLFIYQGIVSIILFFSTGKE